jgi:alkylation response protein AidB-like acyl-CoA dehydrogenase
VPKHKGITALIVDMKTPGVEPRPFPELTEPDFMDFNEVFFTDARVPKANLLGEIDGGWPITQGSLAHERAMLWIDYAFSMERATRALVVLGDEPDGRGGRIGDDPVFRDQVATIAIDTQALLCMGYRGFSKFMAGKSAPEHSLLKQFGSEGVQRALAVGANALGAPGLDRNRLGPQMWREGAWLTQWMRSFGGTIPGGTSEIQRNIIAERVLGLPRR